MIRSAPTRAAATATSSSEIGFDSRIFVSTSPGKQKNVLLHVADERAQLVDGDVANVDAVDEDPPALRIIEPEQQIDDRRLAGPGVADQRERFTRLDFKARRLEHPLRRRRRAATVGHVAEIVGEPDVVEFDRDAAFGDGSAGVRIRARCSRSRACWSAAVLRRRSVSSRRKTRSDAAIACWSVLNLSDRSCSG